MSRSSRAKYLQNYAGLLRKTLIWIHQRDGVTVKNLQCYNRNLQPGFVVELRRKYTTVDFSELFGMNKHRT